MSSDEKEEVNCEQCLQTFYDFSIFHLLIIFSVAGMTEPEEDWEAEASVGKGGYDPTVKCENTRVLRSLRGATRSER